MSFLPPYSTSFPPPHWISNNYQRFCYRGKITPCHATCNVPCKDLCRGLYRLSLCTPQKTRRSSIYTKMWINHDPAGKFTTTSQSNAMCEWENFWSNWIISCAARQYLESNRLLGSPTLHCTQWFRVGNYLAFSGVGIASAVFDQGFLNDYSFPPKSGINFATNWAAYSLPPSIFKEAFSSGAFISMGNATDFLLPGIKGRCILPVWWTCIRAWKVLPVIIVFGRTINSFLFEVGITRRVEFRK